MAVNYAIGHEIWLPLSGAKCKKEHTTLSCINWTWHEVQGLPAQ